MMEADTLAAELWRRQHEAEDALVHGEVGPRLAMWSHREPVTLFAALGPSKRGWAELEPMFRAVASRLSHGQDLSYELIAFDTAGDIAWTVGVSRFTVSIDGGPASRRMLRLTHLYRREDGEWKVVHEHSDFQPPDHETPTPVIS